ncbi:MAG: hypothetical protein DUD33_03385 [Coriobacteriaceae bacterium]|jgi:hypothetical protein|nr:MAG: hypothetical protein DUD33_03385 [Coriobacteriaceae bacterium]
MYFDYAELRDGTVVAFSNILPDNTVKVSVERPVEGGFDSARCILPSYEWTGVEGFTEKELSDLDQFVHDNAPLIMHLAYEESQSYA